MHLSTFQPGHGRELFRLAVRLFLCVAPLQQPLAAAFEQTAMWLDSRDGRSVCIETELALTAEQRARGLMFRQSLPPGKGMLFDFRRTGQISMWMKDTPLSLDMLFIEADGDIVRIVTDTRPLSTELIHSQQPIRFVLELPAGTVNAWGINTGDALRDPAITIMLRHDSPQQCPQQSR